MSLFSRLKRSTIEDELETSYTAIYQERLGLSPDKARKQVRQVIAGCKLKGREEGTADLPEDFGDLLIVQARGGEPAAIRIIQKARNEGARDEDIVEWWNLHDLERRMVQGSEEVFRYASFLDFQDQGLGADEAMRRVRIMFPMYGNPENTTHVSGEDRPLPHELRGRIDKYREKHGAKAILPCIANYSTYNAFVRAEIRAGRL